MATGPNLLTGDDSNFEGGTIGGWTGQNMSLANSTAQAHTGTHSLACTSNATTLGAFTSLDIPITVGATYLGSVYGRANINTAIWRAQFVFFDASHNVVTAPNGTFITDSNTAWTLYQITAVAPVTAAVVRLYWSTAAFTLGDVHYMDDASVVLVGATPTYLQWAANSQSAPGLPVQTVSERSLSALATIATGTNPDGTIRGS